MKVIIAENSGFCFGVKRALDIALDATEKSDNIYSYGQLIHNNQVTERLYEKGLKETDSLDDLQSSDLIIRSHGVGSDVYTHAEKNDINIVDCTCPFVKKVHKIVNEYYLKGYSIIVVGNSSHPEIIGINGWCNNSAIIINNELDIPELDSNRKYCVVAQTTLKSEVWASITESLSDQTKNIEIFNTICSATKVRQGSTTELSKKVDCMVVVGGFHSSNTKKLFEISSKNCKKTYHIEKKSDLVMTNLVNCDTIGITAGASTPDWVINEVYDFISNYNYADSLK